jgi:hypothetical protein
MWRGEGRRVDWKERGIRVVEGGEYFQTVQSNLGAKDIRLKVHLPPLVLVDDSPAVRVLII